MNGLKLDQIKVNKGEKTLLHDVSMVMPKGALTILIGPNGAGKSTLLRVAAGLEKPQQGQVLLDDTSSLLSLPLGERSQRLVWVPDHMHSPFDFTVLDTVIMGLFPWHQGLPDQTHKDACLAALATLGIDHLAQRRITSLSSGEKQKAMIARALAGWADHLLLDEPCANLDIGASLHLLEIMQGMARQGRAVCLSLHDITLANRFADQCVLIHKGQIISAGTPGAVMTAAYLDDTFAVKTHEVFAKDGRRLLFFDSDPNKN